MELPKKQLLTELSKRGNFQWLLEEDQEQIWQFIMGIGDRKSLALHIARRFGKSFLLNLVAFSCGLGNKEVCEVYGVPQKNAQIIYLAETQAQIQNIFIPNLAIALKHLPLNMMPKWDQKRNGYVFPTTGSIIRVAGTDNKNYEKLRGGECHLALLDEAAFHDELAYIYRSIILPQTLRVNGRILFVSTSPKTPDHEFFSICQDHIKKGSYLKLTIDDKKSMSEEAREALIEEMGGRDSTDVKRELYCEWVTDFESMIFPECTEDHMKKIVSPQGDIPGKFDWYAGMDPAAVDYTGYLCGYYDFMRAKLVITGELFYPHEETESLVNDIRRLEGKWFGSQPPMQRVCDNNASMLINDMSRLYQMVFTPARKDDKEAMVNFARVMIKNEKVEVWDHCEHLIRQMKTGLWTKSRRSFERSEKEGHYDLLDALIYLLRIVQFDRNPYNGYDKSFLDGNWVLPDKGLEDDAEALKNVFCR